MSISEINSGQKPIGITPAEDHKTIKNLPSAIFAKIHEFSDAETISRMSATCKRMDEENAKATYEALIGFPTLAMVAKNSSLIETCSTFKEKLKALVHYEKLAKTSRYLPELNLNQFTPNLSFVNANKQIINGVSKAPASIDELFVAAHHLQDVGLIDAFDKKLNLFQHGSICMAAQMCMLRDNRMYMEKLIKRHLYRARDYYDLLLFAAKLNKMDVFEDLLSQYTSFIHHELCQDNYLYRIGNENIKAFTLMINTIPVKYPGRTLVNLAKSNCSEAITELLKVAEESQPSLSEAIQAAAFKNHLQALQAIFDARPGDAIHLAALISSLEQYSFVVNPTDPAIIQLFHQQIVARYGQAGLDALIAAQAAPQTILAHQPVAINPPLINKTVAIYFAGFFTACVLVGIMEAMKAAWGYCNPFT